MKSIHITRKQLLTGLALLSGLIVLIVCGTLWYLIATAPDPDTISLSPSESATYICDSNGNYMRRLTFATSNRDLVTLDEIPKALQQAVIAIEDERFYSHHGIDIHGILRAFFKGITNGSFSEGASTITQQLIKNQVLLNGRPSAHFSTVCAARCRNSTLRSSSKNEAARKKFWKII